MATTDLHFVAGSLQPVKRGVRMLGGAVDDGVQVDAAGAALANVATMGTLTAWVMVPDQTGSYAIIGFGDASADEFITFSIVAGKLEINCTDATTKAYEVTSTDKVIKAHKWHHVAVTHDATRPHLYVDGKQVAMTLTVETDLSKWFKDCVNIDGAHIGAAEEGGAGALTLEFKGYISDVRIWGGTTSDSVLTETQINQVMSGSTVGTAHNIWSLDNQLLDAGSGADDGTAVGDIIFSDANPFASRLTFLETVPLTADNISIMCNEGVGYAYSVLAA